MKQDVHAETPPSESFNQRYAKVMRSVWNHPHNDQRPAILRWMKPLSGNYSSVLDIGAGDAYYLEQLQPTKYTFVEPNETLRQVALAHAARLSIETVAYSTVADLLSERGTSDACLVLMIHVLFYMERDEIKQLLPKVKGKPLLLVYPHTSLAVTMRFEESLGLNESLEKIEIMRSLLGRPQTQQVTRSHFRVSLSADLDSLAFLVGHRTFSSSNYVEKMTLARSFVMRQKHLWKCPNWFELPQAQVLESYNIKIK